MSFKYDLTANQQTPTSDSKVVLCKSFKIDLAAGSGFTTATPYQLGWLPKDAQPIWGSMTISTAVSGGTVSAATLRVDVGGGAVFNSSNVFSAATLISAALHSWMNTGQNSATDQLVTYTPTLTGAGATAGIIYINIFYVV